MGTELVPGIEGALDFEVDARLMTDVGGTLTTPVLSTPSMISLMERTASQLVMPRLPEGKATVGFEVCVKHVAAAFEGARCEAPARLDQVLEARKLRFTVEVVDEEGRTIGVGTHERRIVSGRGG
jgi:fluoroacetyl-CoA thioesterase